MAKYNVTLRPTDQDFRANVEALGMAMANDAPNGPTAASVILINPIDTVERRDGTGMVKAHFAYCKRVMAPEFLTSDQYRLIVAGLGRREVMVGDIDRIVYHFE